MVRRFSFTHAVTALALLVAVDAKPEFPSRLPNGASVPGTTALGHADGTGASESLNAFGKAFDKAGRKWTAALCAADSDGDGQTNGQELGDPCCVWTTGSAAPTFSTGVSHPGDATKTVAPSVLASYSCGANGTSSTPATTTLAPSSLSTRVSSSLGVAMVAAAAAYWVQ